jgi:ribonuclease P protein 1
MDPNQRAKMAEEAEAKHILENLISPEEQKKLAVIRLEYEVLQSNGILVPNEMKNWMWLRLLRDVRSQSGRKKILTAWKKIEFTKQNYLEKKKLRQQVQSEIPRRSLDEPYHNKILQRIENSKYNEYDLAYSVINGPHLLFDMDYSMLNKDRANLMQQLKIAHGVNKLEREPFHFHFCNLSPSSDVHKTVNRHFSELNSLLYTVTESSYMDCYPPEQLVYLSPNSPNILQKFNHDDVYIIGGLVDTSQSKPLSYAKAKRNQIRSAKLPLDKHVRYG